MSKVWQKGSSLSEASGLFSPVDAKFTNKIPSLHHLETPFCMKAEHLAQCTEVQVQVNNIIQYQFQVLHC